MQERENPRAPPGHVVLQSVHFVSRDHRDLNPGARRAAHLEVERLALSSRAAELQSVPVRVREVERGFLDEREAALEGEELAWVHLKPGLALQREIERPGLRVRWGECV